MRGTYRLKYKILDSSPIGTLIEDFPIFSDMFDTFEVSFFMERKGNYVATFKGTDGKMHKSAIKNGVCLFPRAIIRKGINQFVEVSVVELDGADKVKRIWNCEPLKIGSFYYSTRSQFQVSSGVSDEEYHKRVLAVIDENKHIKEELIELYSKVAGYECQVSALSECIKKVVEKHNEMVKEFTKMKEEM